MLPYLLSFATGQSDPRAHALSPAQADFLAAMPAPAESQLARNFPWREATPPWREVPLLPASFYNLRQFFAAQRGAFAGRHRADLEAWAARAERHVVFAGSCGLELLRRLDPPADLCRRLHVFAYGPVVRARPPFEVFAVQGRRDWISQLYVGRPDARVAADHLGYLEDPEVRALAAAFVRRVLGLA